ncbi:acyl-CoA thioesterase [Domibacillus enclensis]|uniref:Acyl-CoA thioester hydrolase n=1 Tax=Domibacillus enclensis TaxID=1017273 RepID=A0A1N6Q350_9BACI|nr:thioesterase family protein [Domibacillus enclensis]OXS80574.1 acyl-CoA thioester hydrolase [Domibacillus enclensis]SIQ11124.1 acyl-CoA thioester hydrolase [Domibacillus enclensis]
MKKPSYIADWEEWSGEFDTYWETVVRFSEIDMLGHLNNTIAFKYFEEARIHFFREKGLRKNWEKDELVFVVADLQCDYIRQVYYHETLRIFVKAAAFGNSSCDLHYKAVNEKNEVVLTGRGTIVQFNQLTGRPVPFHPSTKQLLTKTN